MKIQVVGLNHREAPVAVRERVALGPESLPVAYASRDNMRHQEGVVILSTCNRTELYVAGEVSLSDILAWWESLVLVPRGEFSDALFWYKDLEAAEHLMAVASGIDSMVLGETQILGQVKDAYQRAQEFHAVGHLHRLFQYAFRAAKRAHTETDIGRNALSLGYAVVELCKKVFGTVEDRSALVIGAGDTARLVARHLRAQHVGRMAVANRTRSRAEDLATEVGAFVVDLHDLAGAVRQADIIVSCTSAPTPVISYDMAYEALKGQTHKFRFFFDMAVPRDIDPRVAELSQSIFLYDIDDITHVVNANLHKRQREIQKVERLIREEGIQFQEEMGASQVGPVIRSLREKAEAIRQEELAKAMTRLPNLSDEEREVVADATRLILSKFLNDAMISMRSWGQDDEKRSYVDAVRELFRLAEDGQDRAAEGGIAVPGK